MQNKTVLYSVLAVIAAGIIGVSSWLVLNQQNPEPEAVPQDSANSQLQDSESTDSAQEFTEVEGDVSYDGQEGRTALELLQENAEVELEGEGEMAFVTTINGVSAGENEFWAFYINGASAPMGAGSYVTSNDDRITWRLENF